MAIIATLVAAAIVVTLLEHADAEHQYEFVAKQAQSQRVIGDMRDNLLERFQSGEHYFADGEATDVNDVHSLETEFPKLLKEVLRVGHTETRHGPRSRPSVTRTKPSATPSRPPSMRTGRRRGRPPVRHTRTR